MPLNHSLRIHFKKVLIGKEKKKVINVLTAFFIFHKNDVKIFLKWIFKECPKGTRYHDPKTKYNLTLVMKLLWKWCDVKLYTYNTCREQLIMAWNTKTRKLALYPCHEGYWPQGMFLTDREFNIYPPKGTQLPRPHLWSWWNFKLLANDGELYDLS